VCHCASSGVTITLYTCSEYVGEVGLRKKERKINRKKDKERKKEGKKERKK
jgi:hypothetical protein